MAGHTLIITGKTGPDLALTAKTFDNVERLTFDFKTGALTILSNSKFNEFDISTITGVTVAIAAKLYTVTVT
jgi:hypothetical protein